MAEKIAKTDGKHARPVWERFAGIKHTTVDVDAAVEQIPNTNLSYRKGLVIQNKEASGGNTLYIGGGIPYLIEGSDTEIYTDPDHDKRGLRWIKSTTGNEWYLATSAGGDPGLTQITYLYYTTVSGTATLGTNGTVGSLAAEHNWGWGDGDSLGWSTLYIRTNGASTANTPRIRYETLHAYYFTLTADDATTGGFEITPGNAISLTADASVRVFAIGGAANVDACVIEYV